MNDLNTKSQSQSNVKLSLLFANKKMSDLTFYLNDKLDNPIYAHKFVLSLNSEIFHDLFYQNEASSSSVATTKFRPTTTIENLINQSEPSSDLFLTVKNLESFMVFLKYFYNNNETTLLTLPTVIEVLELSVKYKVKQLEKQCHEFIANIDSTKLTDENIFSLLEIASNAPIFTNNNESLQSTSPSMEEIGNACLEKIGRNLPRLFSHKTFLHISLKSLIKLLTFDLLDCTEYEIYEAILKWAAHPTPTIIAMQKKLGDAKFQIRFPSLTIEEFDRCLDLPNSILTSDEIVRVFRSIISTEKRICDFPSQPRLTYNNLDKFEMKSCKRFTEISTIRFPVSGESILYFFTNNYVYCCGFEIFGLTQSGVDEFKSQTVEFKLDDCLHGPIASNTIKLINMETVKIQKLLFDKPVLITPTRVYKATVNRVGGPKPILAAYGGTNGLLKVKMNDVTFVFNQNYSQRSLNEGPLAGVLFKK